MDFIKSISLLKLLILIKLISDVSAVDEPIPGKPDSDAQDANAPSDAPAGPSPPSPPSESIPSNKLHNDVICCIDTASPELKIIPKECTALASYAKNIYVTTDYIARLQQIKNIPYMLIVDSYVYEDFHDRVAQDQIEGFISELTHLKEVKKADAMVFDYMNSDQSTGELDAEYNQGIRKLFIGLKHRNPNLIIGLGLPKDEKVLKLAFVRGLFDKLVDFYLADTVYFNKCKHKNHQADMANIAPVEQIDAALNMMIKYGYTSEKIVFIIRVVVQTTRFGEAGSDEDMSYSDMCSDTSVGKDRKFCVESLANFYKKGSSLRAWNLKGVFIQSIDRDDVKLTCQVGTAPFPVVKCITDGAFGQPQPEDLTTNKNWALLPQDRH